MKAFASFAGILIALTACEKAPEPPPPAPAPVAPPPPREYTTPARDRLPVTLPDSTHVTLAPLSSLHLVDGFSDSTRAVTLKGEAYFAIDPTRPAPFTVTIGDVTVRSDSAGSKFFVRQYESDKRARITVTEGRVIVTAGSAVDTVESGMIGTATKTTVRAAKTRDLGPYTAWMRDSLMFHDTPLLEVLTALTRWYGRPFKLDDPTLAQEKVSIDLRTDWSPSAFSELRQYLNVDLSLTGDTITMSRHEGGRVGKPIPHNHAH